MLVLVKFILQTRRWFEYAGAGLVKSAPKRARITTPVAVTWSRAASDPLGARTSGMEDAIGALCSTVQHGAASE